MAKSRRFCKSKSVCVGWSGQYLDFALYRRRSAAGGRELCFFKHKSKNLVSNGQIFYVKNI